MLAYGSQGWGISGERWALGIYRYAGGPCLGLGNAADRGVSTAHWLPSRTLACLFAVFLIVNGSHLLYSALG
jgi:uncharacterized protein